MLSATIAVRSAFRALIRSTRALATSTCGDAARKFAGLEEAAIPDVKERTDTALQVRLVRARTQCADEALPEASCNSRQISDGAASTSRRAQSDVRAARPQVDVANARVDLIRARNALRTAIVALNIAMAIDVDSPLQIVDNLIYQPVTIDRQALRADSLRQRPEYRQAKLRAAAAEATERQTFRNFFPDVTGSGAYGGAQTPLNEPVRHPVPELVSLRRRQPGSRGIRRRRRTSRARGRA